MSRLVTDHLPLLAGAPNGVKKLRELILELAVRGKLVPQDLADEPADRLLQRIQAKKYKSTDKHKKSTSNENIKSIPVGWVKTTFHEAVLEIATGPFGSLIHQSDYIYGGIPLINPSHMIDGKISSDPAVSLPEVIASSLGAYRLEPGDMVMARRGEIGRVALVTEKERGWLCGTGSFRLRFTADIDPRFLRVIFCTPSIRKQLAGKAVGTTMVNLNHGALSQLPFLLPPLPEQHRIVAKVDELMALCDRLETRQSDAQAAHARLVDELLGSLLQARDAEDFSASWERLAGCFGEVFSTEESFEKLRQAVIHCACTGRMTSGQPDSRKTESAETNHLPKLPPEWQWTRLGNLCALVTSGSRSWKDYYSESGSTFIRSQDIKHDQLDFDNRAYVRLPENSEGARTQVKKEDILVTITGANVGKSALLTNPPEDAYVSQHVALIRLKETKFAEFIHCWLINNHGGRKILLSSSYGAKPGLNLQNIKDLLIPLPPLEEQRRIVAKVDELLALCDRLKMRIQQARQVQERLAGALVERAVS